MHWKQKLKDNARIIARITDTQQGKDLIKLLNDVFNHTELRGEDTHDTYYRLGQRDVVEYLNVLIGAKLDEH